MTDSAGIPLGLGLIILSFCIGLEYEAITGWKTFGIGLMIIGLVVAFFEYLSPCKKDEEDK